MPKSTHSRSASRSREEYAGEVQDQMYLAALPPRIADAQVAAMAQLAVEADQDGLEPEQVQHYGEEDVPGSELSTGEAIASIDPVGAAAVSEVLDRLLPGSLPTGSINDEDPEDDSFRIEVAIGLTCGCGCGEKTNAGRNFVQGHDQRLIGILAAHRTEEISFTDGDMLITTSATGYGARVFSPAGLAKLERAIARVRTPRNTE